VWGGGGGGGRHDVSDDDGKRALVLLWRRSRQTCAMTAQLGSFFGISSKIARCPAAGILAEMSRPEAITSTVIKYLHIIFTFLTGYCEPSEPLQRRSVRPAYLPVLSNFTIVRRSNRGISTPYHLAVEVILLSRDVLLIPLRNII